MPTSRRPTSFTSWSSSGHGIDGALVPKVPKTERSRRALVLPPSMVAALEAHRVKQPAARTRAGGWWEDTGLVFTSIVGMPLGPRDVLRAAKPHLTATELPDHRVLDLRRCAAPILIAELLPINLVGVMQGHSMTGKTLKTHSHVMPAAQRPATGAMERLLR